MALRLGFRQVDGFSQEWAERIAAARAQGPFPNIEALARRVGLPHRALKLLADADACRSIGLDRRQALWEVRRTPDGVLPLFAASQAAELGTEPQIALPKMPLSEHVITDYQTTRLSLKDHPMRFLRPLFRTEGVLSSAEVAATRKGKTIKAAGVVLIRQRPGKGNAIFVTLEDETGVVNVLIWARLFEIFRRPVMSARLLMAEGVLERSPEGVTHLMATRLYDRTAELDRLMDDGGGRYPLHEDGPPREPSPRHAEHPRNVRILPKSRDFH